MLVTMKNAGFWDIKPRECFKEPRFGGTLVLTRSTRRKNPENGIPHFPCTLSELVLQCVKDV
jgi:hypothetical protein